MSLKCRVQTPAAAGHLTLRHQHHHLILRLHCGPTPLTQLHHGLTPGKEGYATRRPQYVPAPAPMACPSPFALAPIRNHASGSHHRSRALTACSRALRGASQRQVRRRHVEYVTACLCVCGYSKLTQFQGTMASTLPMAAVRTTFCVCVARLI